MTNSERQATIHQLMRASSFLHYFAIRHSDFVV